MEDTKLVVAIRHVHFEDCGTLEDVLVERGFRIRYVEAGREDLRSLDLPSIRLLVCLGGPVAAYDEALYPWIGDELNLIEKCVAARKPTLGICLGAQMLARVLGARVYPSGLKELGWKPLVLTDAGNASCIAPLAPERTSMLHWHGDTFDLPPQATLLASTPDIPQQIFGLGKHALGFQCHPEIRASDIESWLIGHACEISLTHAVTVAQLRSDTARLGPALARQAKATFAAWLTAAEL